MPRAHTKARCLVSVAAALTFVARVVRLSRDGSGGDSVVNAPYFLLLGSGRQKHSCLAWPRGARSGVPNGRCRRTTLRVAPSSSSSLERPLHGQLDELEKSVSPSEFLRHWRSRRRAKLLPSIEDGWARENGCLRGDDAAFQLQNIGALVGGPPRLWVYFVASSGNEALLRAACRIFQTVLDATQSYTILSFSQGLIPKGPSQEEDEDAGDEAAVGAFDASTVFRRYDVVVAVDALAQEQAQSLAARVASAGGARYGEKVSALTDFMDVCESWPTAALGPQLSDLGNRGLAVLYSYADIPDEEDAVASDMLALSVAGFERFVIAKFPEELAESLHPYLRPAGL